MNEDIQALIEEANGNIERAASAAPDLTAERIRKGDVEDQRLSLIVRMSAALSALSGETETAMTGQVTPDREVLMYALWSQLEEVLTGDVLFDLNDPTQYKEFRKFLDGVTAAILALFNEKGNE